MQKTEKEKLGEKGAGLSDMNAAAAPPSEAAASATPDEALVSALELSFKTKSWTGADPPLQPVPAEAAPFGVAESAADGAHDDGAPGTSTGCARIVKALRRATGLDEAHQLRQALARVTAERDAARRERDQLNRLCGDLKQQLVEERKPARTSTEVPGELSREAIELMREGLEVVASDLYVHEVVSRVVAITTRVLSCERVTLFLADGDRQELTVLACADHLETLRVPYNQGLVGACARGRQVINVVDAYSDNRFHKEVDAQTGFHTRAVLCCPLIDVRGELVAVLQAINPIDGTSFTARDEQLLQIMQMPTSIALLNARLQKSLRSANESASSLVRVAMVVNAQNAPADESATSKDGSLTALMEKVVAEAKLRFDADRCSMYVADHEKGELWSLVAMGLPDRFSVRFGQGISGQCAETGELINVRDAKADPRTAHSISQSTGYTMRSTLCIPVIDRRLSGPQRILGVIQLLNKTVKPDYFTVQDEASLQAFSNIVSLAMRNAMVFDDLRQRDVEREMIFSSISSFICKFSSDGKLEWCNSPKLLETVLAVPEARMREARFDQWLAPIKTSGGAGTAVDLLTALDECLKSGAQAKARNAELRPSDDNGEPSMFFNFSLTPLMRADLSTDAGEERQVGALLVMEDVSDQHKRKQAEEKLSKLEAQIRSEQSARTQALSETPLQKAIDVVTDLRDTNPELREPLQEILTQLTSQNVMMPSVMTDASKMASMDDFTREFLGGQTGVQLHPEPGRNRRRNSGGSLPSWKEHAATLDMNRRAAAKDNEPYASSSRTKARRSSLPTPASLTSKTNTRPFEGFAAPQQAPGADGSSPRPPSGGSRAAAPPEPASSQSPAAPGELVVRRGSAPDTISSARDGPGREHANRRSSDADANVVEALLAAMSPTDWTPPSFVVNDIFSWDLDLYDPSRGDRGNFGGAGAHELAAIAHELFESVNIREVLGVSSSTVQSFIVAVREGYLPMPFHNFSHAVYVLHGCVMCLQRCELLHTLLDPVEKVALCIAALGHDIGHTGVQNGFLINSNDPLALMYNDKSVLEQMHCSRLFSVLRQRGSTLLDGLSAEQYKAVRKSMIGMIMATDLSNHFEDIERFKNRLRTQEERPWSADNADDRKIALEMVLHAADLSGPARPWPVSHAWASKVQEEFVNQVAAEGRLGIPVSTFLTADKAKLETGFMDLFANPVWTQLSKLLPEAGDRVTSMEQNYARWAAELQSAKAVA